MWVWGVGEKLGTLAAMGLPTGGGWWRCVLQPPLGRSSLERIVPGKEEDLNLGRVSHGEGRSSYNQSSA